LTLNAGRPSFLHVNLCTYRDLGPAGQAIVEFVEMALRLADSAGIAVRISLERERPRRPKAGRKLTPNTWRQMREAVLAGEYGYLFVFNDSASGLADAALPDRVMSFALAIHAANLYGGLAARARSASARELLLHAAQTSPRFVNLAVAFGGGGIEPQAEELERIVRVVGETFRQINGVCGFITLDPFQFIGGDVTQHELARRAYWATTPDIYQTHVRGVFWGNLLSPRHVALLGGYGQVTREAPCQFVAPLLFGQSPSEESTGAYLQLTEHPATVSRQQLDALTRYLTPLL
jgi:hypothetical protein